MRLGDYVLCLSMILNLTAACAYGYQGHWRQVGYWLSALSLNYFLMLMR